MEADKEVAEKYWLQRKKRTSAAKAALKIGSVPARLKPCP
jgi:hypothetical protein